MMGTAIFDKQNNHTQSDFHTKLPNMDMLFIKQHVYASSMSMQRHMVDAILSQHCLPPGLGFQNY